VYIVPLPRATASWWAVVMNYHWTTPIQY